MHEVAQALGEGRVMVCACGWAGSPLEVEQHILIEALVGAVEGIIRSDMPIDEALGLAHEALALAKGRNLDVMA